jgi:hypothetical protein
VGRSLTVLNTMASIPWSRRGRGRHPPTTRRSRAPSRRRLFQGEVASTRP